MSDNYSYYKQKIVNVLGNPVTEPTVYVENVCKSKSELLKKWIKFNKILVANDD